MNMDCEIGDKAVSIVKKKLRCLLPSALQPIRIKK